MNRSRLDKAEERAEVDEAPTAALQVALDGTGAQIEQRGVASDKRLHGRRRAWDAVAIEEREVVEELGVELGVGVLRTVPRLTSAKSSTGRGRGRVGSEATHLKVHGPPAVGFEASPAVDAHHARPSLARAVVAEEPAGIDLVDTPAQLDFELDDDRSGSEAALAPCLGTDDAVRLE